jgi:hypothetical protein
LPRKEPIESRGKIKAEIMMTLSKFDSEHIGNWGFPEIRIPPNGWFITENPTKMDDFGDTPILGNLQLTNLPGEIPLVCIV